MSTAAAKPAISRAEYVAIAAALPLTKNKAAQVESVRACRYYPNGKAFMLLPSPVRLASDAEIAAAFAEVEYDKAVRANSARLERDAE